MFLILFIFRNVLISRIVRSSLHEGPDTCQNLEYTDNRQIYSADYSYNKNNKNNKNNLDDCGISSKKNTKKYDKVRMCSTCLVDLSECKDSSHCEVKESSFNLFLYDRFLSYCIIYFIDKFVVLIIYQFVIILNDMIFTVIVYTSTLFDQFELYIFYWFYHYWNLFIM